MIASSYQDSDCGQLIAIYEVMFGTREELEIPVKGHEKTLESFLHALNKAMNGN